MNWDKLSPGAQAFLASLPSDTREKLKSDIEHLTQHPDPAGDESGLRFVVILINRQRKPEEN